MKWAVEINLLKEDIAPACPDANLPIKVLQSNDCIYVERQDSPQEMGKFKYKITINDCSEDSLYINILYGDDVLRKVPIIFKY